MTFWCLVSLWAGDTKVGRLSFHREKKGTELTPRISIVLCFRGGGKGH